MVLLTGFSSFLFAQQTIEGTVVDKTDNSPLIGVSVYEKGTTIGTVTDFDGNYSLSVSGEESVIVFSFVGYTPVEQVVGTAKTFNVALEADTESLEEVVVVGYGTQKKSHLTGAISKVGTQGLDQIPVARADEALVGKVSGVTIQMTDASAGAAPTIRVRGIGSITADASPLVVLDGVVVDSDYLGSIDMNDVESIEILKDAASAAIYGSRGGNGVVMITSKLGKEGKTKFSFNAYYGVKFTAKFDDAFQSVNEWSQYVTSNNNGELTDRMKYIQQMGTETDWVDTMFDGGTIQSYSLSARGGSESTKYSISGSYLSDEGVLLTDSYEKINFKLNLKTKVNKSLEFGGIVNPSYTSKRDFPIGIHDALRQQPWLPLYLDENSIQYVDKDTYPDAEIGDYAKERMFDNYDLYGDGGDVDISTTSNVSPLAKVLEREQRVRDFKLFSNAYLKLKLMKGLNFKSSFSVSYRNKEDEEYQGSLAHRDGATATEGNYDTDIYTHWVSENVLSYNTRVGDHDISAVAGASAEKWHHTSSDMTGTGYEFDYITTINAATEISEASTYKVEESLVSAFGRFNYAYKDKYLVSLSARVDGSSKFGADTKYGFFPAASLGWRMTEEDFMQDLDFVSNLKLRASVGVTGNNSGIGEYDAISTLDVVTAVIDGNATTGYSPSNLANTDLGWEKSVETGLGFDLGILDNKFTVGFDVYQRTSKDLLLDQDIPSVTGFSYTTVNIGEVQNRGIEIELGARLFSNSEINWSVSGNMSFNENELTDFADASGLISYVDSKRPAEYIALEGQPISSFYGYKYEKDIPLEYIDNPYYPMNVESEDVYVKDLNGDGEITTDDRTILGSPYPTFTWGFTNNLSVKNWDMSFTLQGSHGAKVRNMDPQYYGNQFSSKADYTDDFPDADFVLDRIYTDLFVQDASFIALRAVNLGYTLPKSLISKYGLGNARFYVSGQNLLYLMSSEYTSFNPEGVTDNSSPLRGGYQRGAAPIAKAFTVGVNLEF